MSGRQGAPAPKSHEKSWGRWFLDLLWQQPLLAVPFAIFFGTLNGGTRAVYFGSYIVSLYFAYSITFAMTALGRFVMPRIERSDDEAHPGRMVLQFALYAGASLIGAFAAALAVRWTIFPTFLGNPREVAIIAMFTLLFTALFMGVATAVVYYRKAIDRAKVEEEMHLARRIQRSFLISQFPTMPKLEVHAINVSSKEVSGDFYDFVPAGPKSFLLAIADVSGKGVPAALLSSMLQASLRTQAHSIPSVAAILGNINTLVYRSAAVSQFATFFLARIDEDTLELAYSNAGHNYPMVFRDSGAPMTLEKGGTVVGILESTPFEEGRLSLSPGDRVLFYTDGINEATNAAGEMYGEERLAEFVAALAPDLAASEITERVLESVREFLDGIDAGDDMTVMVLRVLDTA